MKSKEPAIILYFISGFIYLISLLFNVEFMIVLTKPMIASSMLFYYLQQSIGAINFKYVVILFLLFIGGLFNLFEDEFALIYTILLNLSAYSFLLFLVIQDLKSIKNKDIDVVNSGYILLTLILLSSFVYVCLFMIFDSSLNIYFFIIIYSIVLLLLGTFTTILYVFSNSSKNLNLIIAVFCFIVCDLFYVLYYYYYDFIFIRYISIICNILSFYFIVNYFLKRSISLKINNK